MASSVRTLAHIFALGMFINHAMVDGSQIETLKQALNTFGRSGHARS